MSYRTLQQDIDLWEAWIEFDPVSTHHFGTLFILGDILVDKKGSKPCVIKNLQKTEVQALVLKLYANTSNPAKITEVVYSEPIYNPGQYHSVKIFRDEELIAEIKDIEVVV